MKESEINMKTSSSKMALKPYLEAVREHCQSLSKDELVETILEIAQERPIAARMEFLDKIRAITSRAVSAVSTVRKSEEHIVESMLERIEALKEEIIERIESIEDGSYWDDRDHWHHDDEDPEYLTDEQSDELETLFVETGGLFLDGQLEAACRLYGTLFELMGGNDAIRTGFSPPSSDIREARARYCRCVHETSDPSCRLDNFFHCMEVHAPMNHYRLDLPSEPFPMLQDVLDARPGEVPGWESFLPAWEEKLRSHDTARAAMLRMEAVFRLEGIRGLARLTGDWKSRQPCGYLFLIQHLEEARDWRGMIDTCREALDALPKNSFREQAAGYLVKAAMQVREPSVALLGKRESFLSAPHERNLLELLEEADKQGVRSNELGTVLTFKEEFKDRGDGRGSLYLKILLMAGRLEEAFAEGKNEKGVGWSYGKAGVLFAGILSALTESSPKAVVIIAMLKEYAKGSYSGFHGGTEEQAGIYREIVKGLAPLRLTTPDRKKYLEWADRIGRDRVHSIVANQHRGAYNRAAQVLGALAECCLVLGERERASSLLNEFVHVKFRRHHAFRSEVKCVVAGSVLLKELRAM
jgi:hypothetical protein